MSGTDLSRGGAPLADAVRALYRQGQSDYSLEPLVLVDGHGKPIGRIQDGDAVVFCCRRGEREIQFTEAFVDPTLDRFPRREFQALTFVTLTLYHEKFKDLPVAIAPTRGEDTLGEIVSRAGLRQLRVAESEKYAHVTFFFNGGNFPFLLEEVAHLIGIKVVYLTGDAIRMKRKWKRDIDYRKKYEPTYFRNRYFRGQFLMARKCYRPQMQMCDMVVDTTGAAIWATPETAEILKVGQ